MDEKYAAHKLHPDKNKHKNSPGGIRMDASLLFAFYTNHVLPRQHKVHQPSSYRSLQLLQAEYNSRIGPSTQRVSAQMNC